MPGRDLWQPPPPRNRVDVSTPPGRMIQLIAVRDDEVIGIIEIDAPRAIQLAGDLIAAASPRLEPRPG
jgi:hypothetical protein